MYLPNLSDMPNRRFLTTTPTLSDTSTFTLPISGIAGFFGGDTSALTVVHVYKYWQWLGWYNTPGSFQIAKRYGLIAKSTFFKGLFPGVRVEPAELLEFEGRKGERFQAVSSGTIINTTGHLASVLMKECASMAPIPERDGSCVGVTIVKLREDPLPMVTPERTFTYSAFFGIIPIASSLGACIASGLYQDQVACSLILWGILSNGISCLVIGFGTLCFTHPKPAPGSPAGDGILGTDKEFVLLQGPEGAVNSITLGRFSLEFPSESFREYIGYCSVLLTIQSIFQLSLIPHASLFGQILFIFSLVVSWIYNSCLFAPDIEKIQRRIFLKEILKAPSMEKYILPTRTAAVVFALCVLNPKEPEEIVRVYLPNSTRVWKKWKEVVLEQFPNRTENRLDFTQEDLKGFTGDDKKLFEELLQDAKDAYKCFLKAEAYVAVSSATDAGTSLAKWCCFSATSHSIPNPT